MVVASARRVVGEQAKPEAPSGRAIHLTPATAQGSGPHEHVVAGRTTLRNQLRAPCLLPTLPIGVAFTSRC
jgi:hypothetical protein